MSALASPLAFAESAYQKLTHNELTFFLKVRNLPTSGTDHELAARLANHDYHTYHFPNAAHDIPSPPSPSLIFSSPGASHARSSTPDLPTELVALIMDHVGDWELSRALGIPTSIPQPLDWSRATKTDYATLTGHLPTIRAAKPNDDNPLTQLGATFAVRCGYDDLIPIKASRHGRTCVLSWWKHVIEQHADLISPPARGTISEAVDGASRNGQVVSLDWWFNCGLPFDYTEAALDTPAVVYPSKSVAPWIWPAKQVMLKSWNGGQPLNSSSKVLDWWLGSGLQLIFDQEALVGATRHNRPEVLEWWDKSGLPIQYRMCDIEEALEDAIGGGEDARKWWREKGVDFNANDKEWMKLQNLN
ncbi:hypothetical protein Agabi119p4_2055 [Agaricus bisporus var. burnettii]|uniref:SAP domain-containing protein n=1 Tax=Agaricus bisporus var. burnettii TaxID=192524 RepID=A0A8H7F8P9_AGABI|nr:hypothetical protein Agabi119p4_2055 [Agaricus bisporus var. burnettii]